LVYADSKYSKDPQITNNKGANGSGREQTRGGISEGNRTCEQNMCIRCKIEGLQYCDGIIRQQES